MSYQLLVAAKQLETGGIDAEVIHVPTVKPLDEETILVSLRKTGRAVTSEEAQTAGGFGGAVTELLSEQLPVPVMRLGMRDCFGESGTPTELLEHFGLTGEKMAEQIKIFVSKVPQYKQGF
jgi:transketolase